MTPRTPKHGRPTADQLANVELPSQIRCRQCAKNRMQSRFSNTQLNAYRHRVYQRGAIQAECPTCSLCTGGSKDEKECYDCQITKGLDRFSKRQRAKDDARCKDCQQEKEDLLPNVEDAMQETEIIEEMNRNGSSILGSIQALGSALPPMSRTTSNGGRSQASGSESDGVWITDEVPIQVTSPRNRLHNVRNPKQQTRHSSGSSDETISTTHTTATTAPGSSNWSGFDLSYRSGDGSKVVSGASRNPGFHKQRAVPKDKFWKAQEAHARDTRREEDLEAQRARKGSDDDDQSDFEM